MLGIFEAIAGFFKAIPYVGDFIKWLSDTRTTNAERKNEVEALERHAAKDAAIDDYFDSVRQRAQEDNQSVSQPVGQHPKANGSPAIPQSGSGGA